MGCDLCVPAASPLCGGLSVSSNGSNGLRPGALGRRCSTPHTFSILERIEWAATRAHQCQCWEDSRFQYPRTDRMGCDRGRHARPDGRHALSVSSNGSNGLRHRTAKFSSCFLYSFSILERIEWAATRARSRTETLVCAFSILERIEWAATAAASASG